MKALLTLASLAGFLIAIGCISFAVIITGKASTSIHEIYAALWLICGVLSGGLSFVNLSILETASEAKQ